MALPTKTDLSLLATTWLGRPFAEVEAKALLTTELDVTWLGRLFVGAPPVATTSFQAAWARNSNTIIGAGVSL
jgi:hypothetical protein